MEQILKILKQLMITGGMLGMARTKTDERLPTDMVLLVSEVLVLVKLSQPFVETLTELKVFP